jgi:hypothetical protein
MIIPLGDAFAFKDEKGQTRYPYIKIPLDQNLRFFKKFFEASVDMTLGEPVDAKGTANALGQLTPVGTSSLPPTVAAALGYVSNIDFWRMENIWKKGEARSLQLPKWLTKAEVGGQEEERIPGQTPAIAGQVGTATGLSPERLRYVMRTLIGNSMWANLVGAGYEKAFSSVPPAQRQQALAEWLARTPGVSRFFGITSPYSTFEESAKQKEEMSTGKRLIQNGGLDLRIEGYLYKGNFTKQEVLDYIKSWKDPEVMKRMEEDLKFAQEAKGIDHIGYWLTLRRLPVDARAAQFVETVSQASLEEKKEIRNEAGRIMMIGKKPNEPPTGGGVLTDEFWLEVAKLQRAGVKYPGLR